MKNNILKHSSIIFFILTFVLTFLININICYLGDDFYYKTFTNGDFADYINSNITHYLEVNGRVIVHILASFFLWINFNFWKIFNSLMLAGIVYFGSKLASYKSKNKYALLNSNVIFFSGVCFLDILITRQSVYWLTGSFNYVYPILMLLSYWYFLVRFNNENMGFVLTLILSFFASATVEQISAMVFGLTLLVIINNWILYKFRKN